MLGLYQETIGVFDEAITRDEFRKAHEISGRVCDERENLSITIRRIVTDRNPGALSSQSEAGGKRFARCRDQNRIAFGKLTYRYSKVTTSISGECAIPGSKNTG